MDMFKIMFKDYEPFVEIATEKMVQTQIRLLARKFADMIAHREKYLEYSRFVIDDTLWLLNDDIYKWLSCDHTFHAEDFLIWHYVPKENTL